MTDNANLYAHFQKKFPADLDTQLLLTADGRNVTYAEAVSASARIANGLLALGVTPGDRVTVQVDKSAENLFLYLACLRAGLVYHPLNTAYTASELSYFLGNAEPCIVVCGNESVATIESVLTTTGTPESGVRALLTLNADGSGSLMEQTEGASTEAQVAQSSGSDMAALLYSSGTTGIPKCIVHGVGGTLLQHVKELALHTDLKEDDKLFYYTTCGWMMWNWLVSGLSQGATLVLFDGSPFHPSPNILFDIADEENISIFGVSAKYFSACEKAGLRPETSHKLSSLKSILSTGSPLSHESFDYIYQQIKPDICVSSISGGTDIISCFALGMSTLPVYRGELQCAGLGMDLAFYDEQGESLKHGKGELVCLTPFPSMPVGFWNDADNAKYKKAYFESFEASGSYKRIWAHGDYGEFVNHYDSNKQLIQRGVIIHGRSDAVLNPGGVRIGTAEIYRQVEKVESVLESIAIGQQWQDDVRVILFVKLNENITLTDHLITEIKTIIRTNTTPRHVPAKIIQVSDIPRTISGKIVELAVRNVVHGIDVKNKDALANPEALKLFEGLDELK
jgi:acetoacetyl-CoA synthetase